ncbi:MFS transporter [Stakelama pacifica]|uniref:ACS family hexuronate transporter-like MFS transporter n=1 Tax=Stakelama pacifica TaxID=517720 RepID=A0A4R6FNS4_9SPHN|nr:MFS transporter [Stakelama pacifica]TDN82325.1 ACS family hexuronate transporter-like MFS transporter [Stakelama pacifica]GGO95629.1 MFS transporter [Stakelama pacifica]
MSDSAAATPPAAPVKPRGRIRWIVCALLFFAVVLSYMDRLVLPVLKPDLSARYHWSEDGYADLAAYFQLVYGIGYVFAGWAVDRLGARWGYAIAMAMWTFGHVLHTAFTSTSGMLIARVPLGLGEAATFPAALKSVSDWFPKRERAFAIGIFNAGSNVGAIITPLLVPWIVVGLGLGWRAAFFVTGALSIVWIAIWVAFYRTPREKKSVSAEEVAWIEADPMPEPTGKVRWAAMFRHRQTWAYMLGRFIIDPFWWTFLFWLPDFFSRRFDLNLSDFGPPLVVAYIMADVGSIAGGWGSSRLLARGRTTNKARKMAMFGAALCAVPIMFATEAPSLWIAVLLIGLALAGHQAFSANLYALPGDLFPRAMVGSVVGIGGLSGAIGGFLMAKSAGWILDSVGSFRPIFIAAGCAYLVALLVIHLVVPRWQPIHGGEA